MSLTRTQDDVEQTPTATSVSSTAVTVKAATAVPEVQKQEPQIDLTGGVHDGPFPIFDTLGKKTDATVQIIRSPEETLLQFEGTMEKHSDGALIYFSTDIEATKFFSIGQAKLNDSILIYGMPIDTNMNSYNYILIYNPSTSKTEFSAPIEGVTLR